MSLVDGWGKVTNNILIKASLRDAKQSPNLQSASV